MMLKKMNENIDYVQKLPSESWINIFKMLPKIQLNAVATSCNYFSELTSSDSYLWQLKFKETFGTEKKPTNLTWKQFYLNYSVTWAFGENTCGRLGQGMTSLAHFSQKKNNIQQIFQSAVISNYCTAFFDKQHRVWLAGMLPNRTITNTPILYITDPVKQIVFNKGKILYINRANQLCDSKNEILLENVAYVSSEFCLDIKGNVCTYKLQNNNFITSSIEASHTFKEVKENYFKDIQNRLWTYSAGNWSPFLIDGQHLPVYDYDVNSNLVAILDHQKQLRIGRQVRLKIISTQPFEQVVTGYDHTLVINSQKEVWGMGKNNYGQLKSNNTEELEMISGIRAQSVAAGNNCTVIMGSTY
jgi:hypothetical protein